MLTTGSDSRRGSALLALAGLASIGAGAIHATAAGSHSEHRQAVVAFVAVAVVQLSWGVLALARSVPVLAWLGAGFQVAAIGGWVLAKTSGIGFVDGLDEAEDVQYADALAAGLAAVAVVAIVLSLVGWVPGWAAGLGSRVRRGIPQAGLTTAVVLAGVVLVVPGMVAAGSHGHAGGDGEGDGGAGDGHHAEPAAADAAAAHDDDHAASEGRPFDPAMPIDLGGTPGVTPQQQAEAENLLAITLVRLPQFADPAVAEARGYRSIGDGITGFEHYVNRDLATDGRILDPDHPESLVYQRVYNRETGSGLQLVAAMFMLERGSTMEDVPDIGGDLIQWHIHDNLCFSPDPVAPQVASVTPASQPCPGDTVRGPQSPMVHVWITPHRCGPFAALEGVGGGQVTDGEARLCDHAHGS
jgi:hypothetical protein